MSAPVRGMFWHAEPVDKSVSSATRENHLAASRASSIEHRIEIVCAPRAEFAGVEEVGVGDDGRVAPADVAVARRSRSALIAHLPDSEPGDTVRIVSASQLSTLRPALGRERRGEGPNARASPVSMNIGGGRSGSPSGRLLGHSSIGSASSRTRPPLAHPLIERDQVLGRSGRADAPSAAAGPSPDLAGSVTLIGTTL